MHRQLLFSVMGLMILLSFTACPQPGGKEVIDPDCRDSLSAHCKKLQTKYDTDRFILTFRSSTDAEKRASILTKLEDKGHKVAKRCGCDDAVLLEKKNDPKLDFNEQIAQSEDDIEDTGDIGKNFLMNIGPIAGDPPGQPPIEAPSEPLRNPNFPDNQVVVGIVDLGMDLGHCGLRDFVWSNPNPNQDCFNGDENTYDFAKMDGNNISIHYSHGTHIGGIISMKENHHDDFKYNNVEKQLRLMSLKISEGNSKDAYLFDAICAIKYAIKQKVDILNVSWGYYACEADSALARVMLEAGEAGILVVAAAGNDKTNIDNCHFWPAAFSEIYPHVISVAAVNIPPKEDQFAEEFSNYGQVFVQVAAPGVEIKSFINGNSCGTMTGTSMAAPFVSRMAAIIKLANPGIKLADIRSKIIQHSSSIFLPDKLKGLKVPHDGLFDCQGCP